MMVAGGGWRPAKASRRAFIAASALGITSLGLVGCAGSPAVEGLGPRTAPPDPLAQRRLAQNGGVCVDRYGYLAGGNAWNWLIEDCGMNILFSATIVSSDPNTVQGYYIDSKTGTRHNFAINYVDFKNGPPAILYPDDQHKLTYDGSSWLMSTNAGQKILSATYNSPYISYHDFLNGENCQQNVGEQPDLTPCQTDELDYIVATAAALVAIAAAETVVGLAAAVAAEAEAYVALQRWLHDCPE